jgi:photosystem II stability/assembly factor-like uncharacterized protein
MRLILPALLAGAVLAAPAAAADLRNFEDAGLNAVTFVDAREGWAVGQDGVVWHTIDGGRNWERQPTGVRASLRSVQFLNPFTGWAAGREELPHNGGSLGVLLFTRDGGLHWVRVDLGALPGLNYVHFLDNSRGFAVGDGSDQLPTGVFTTVDSGRSWQVVTGPRCPGWLTADFQDAQHGILGGPWSRLYTYQQGALSPADADPLRGRSVTGLQRIGDQAVAVAQGGLLLRSDGAGGSWRYADVGLPAGVQASWDFHGLHCHGDHIWVVGRPGSAVLHSGDRGRTWDVRATGQPLPLNAVYFVDDQHGWAVGELGSILGTEDGGKSWRVQQRGGQRAALLFVQARSAGLPVDAIARLGGEEGYLAVGVRINGSDPDSASPGRAAEGLRVAAAIRQCGGAAGEMLWQFPVAEHQARVSGTDLIKGWDRMHRDRAEEELLRQFVLMLRVWRPDVVVTDHPDAHVNGFPAEALVAAVMDEAFARAADPSAFPEQLKLLGLKPWKAAKLYSQGDEHTPAQVVVDVNEVCPRLETTPRDFAASAAGLLTDGPQPLPTRRFYQLRASTMPGAAGHRDLMQGVPLAEGGTARRADLDTTPLSEQVKDAVRARRNLEALAEAPVSPLLRPDQVLAQVAPVLRKLPEDQGAAAAYTVASHYARLGQWTLARELFLLMAERYPANARTLDAYRWLIRYSSSSEARRRQDMGQFLMVNTLDFRKPPMDRSLSPNALGAAGAMVRGGTELVQRPEMSHFSDGDEVRQWNEGALALGARLASFGPLFTTDPSIQFCLHAARRNLGQFEPARQWYLKFRDSQNDGPWRDAAAAELWLENRSGLSPKPALTCRQTTVRPFLDGDFEDGCWQGVETVRLHDAVGATTKDYATEVRLAYDRDFLYLAVRCRHPAGKQVPKVRARPRDADLRPYDRVSLLLDLDRDYSTYFRLEVDQRGCVCEDCWGDLSWNPRWFVAVRSERTEWRVEAAIPMMELSGDTITIGRAWACNVVRTLPGRGVQAFSTPADVQPRPEGMGLLLFTAPPKEQAEAADGGRWRPGTTGKKLHPVARS